MGRIEEVTKTRSWFSAANPATRSRCRKKSRNLTKSGEELFARNVRVLRLELEAWLAHLAQDREASVALMHEAADLEASTPKTRTISSGWMMDERRTA